MLAKHRMALHQIPEIGFHEFKTKKYLYEQVKNSGGVLHEIGETGLLLYFDNHQQETIAFRTDIDALPIKEETDLPFASTHEGFMHACGHDGHMAMLLGLTDYVSQHVDELLYNVVLIFQPSEEISGGAESVIQLGYWIIIKLKQSLAFIYGRDYRKEKCIHERVLSWLKAVKQILSSKESPHILLPVRRASIVLKMPYVS